MNLPIFLSLTLLFLLFSPPIFSLTPPPSSTLDPKQLTALQSLNIPINKDPCSNPPPLHNTTLCDNSKPFHHLITLHLINCSQDVSLSNTALKSLSTLHNLHFINCPIPLVTFPSELANNLVSFSCINSFNKLTGVWLSHLQNVTDLTVTDVLVNASGPSIFFTDLKKLKTVAISRTNLTGFLPKSWHPSLTHIDLSQNQLKGHIPSSITKVANLVSLNLSSNRLNGELPTSIGDLIELKNLSVSSNSISGSIPESLISLSSLVHLDLGSNQFNGSIPKFLSEMKDLKHLNLENNNFHGIMPFNGSFIKRLEVFKIGNNANLCYNHSSISPKVKLGIAPCDKNGLPITAPAKAVSSDNESGDDGGSSEDETSQKSGGNHGPNKVVVGVAVTLSVIVFLIIFLIILAKRCA